LGKIYSVQRQKNLIVVHNLNNLYKLYQYFYYYTKYNTLSNIKYVIIYIFINNTIGLEKNIVYI
jgi:hypothetical protein